MARSLAFPGLLIAAVIAGCGGVTPAPRPHSSSPASQGTQPCTATPMPIPDNPPPGSLAQQWSLLGASTVPSCREYAIVPPMPRVVNLTKTLTDAEARDYVKAAMNAEKWSIFAEGGYESPPQPALASPTLGRQAAFNQKALLASAQGVRHISKGVCRWPAVVVLDTLPAGTIVALSNGSMSGPAVALAERFGPGPCTALDVYPDGHRVDNGSLQAGETNIDIWFGPTRSVPLIGSIVYESGSAGCPQAELAVLCDETRRQP